MAASFFMDEKRVSNAKAKALLGFRPAYPTYREGFGGAAGRGRGVGRLGCGLSDAGSRLFE